MTINEKYTWWSNSTGIFGTQILTTSQQNLAPRLGSPVSATAFCSSLRKVPLLPSSDFQMTPHLGHGIIMKTQHVEMSSNDSIYIYIYLFIYLRYDMVIYLYMVIYRPMVQSSPPSVSVSVIAALESWLPPQLLAACGPLHSAAVLHPGSPSQHREEHLHSLPLRRCVAWRKYGEVMVKLGDQHVSTHLKTMKIWVSSRWK